MDALFISRDLTQSIPRKRPQRRLQQIYKPMGFVLCLSGILYFIFGVNHIVGIYMPSYHYVISGLIYLALGLAILVFLSKPKAQTHILKGSTLYEK